MTNNNNNNYDFNNNNNNFIINDFKDQSKFGKIFIVKWLDYVKGKITIFKNSNNNYNKNVILRIETELNNNQNLRSISCLCGKKYNFDPYLMSGIAVYRRKLSLMSKHLTKCNYGIKGLYGSDIELSINEFLYVSKDEDQSFGKFKN